MMGLDGMVRRAFSHPICRVGTVQGTNKKVPYQYLVNPYETAKSLLIFFPSCLWLKSASKNPVRAYMFSDLFGGVFLLCSTSLLLLW